jgi:hypothetical protein
MTKSLFTAFETGEAKTIAEAILKHEFSMVDVGKESDEEHSALVAELDDFSGIICFTGEEFAQTFANTVEEALNENNEMSCFMLPGKDFLDSVPAELGVLINAESEENFAFSPEFMQEVKSHV